MNESQPESHTCIIGFERYPITGEGDLLKSTDFVDTDKYVDPPEHHWFKFCPDCGKELPQRDGAFQ